MMIRFFIMKSLFLSLIQLGEWGEACFDFNSYSSWILLPIFCWIKNAVCVPNSLAWDTRKNANQSFRAWRSSTSFTEG